MRWCPRCQSACTASSAGTSVPGRRASTSATPGVAEVLARLGGTEAATLAAAHADWHLEHQRVGELLLVAAPGYQFADGTEASLPSNHGRPEDTEVPLFVTGGSPAIVAARDGTEPPALVDVAPTIATLLGLRLPRRVDGRDMPASVVGHRCDAILASGAGQSPH